MVRYVRLVDDEREVSRRVDVNWVAWPPPELLAWARGKSGTVEAMLPADDVELVVRHVDGFVQSFDVTWWRRVSAAVADDDSDGTLGAVYVPAEAPAWWTEAVR